MDERKLQLALSALVGVVVGAAVVAGLEGVKAVLIVLVVALIGAAKAG